jgi:hypothetical protein
VANGNGKSRQPRYVGVCREWAEAKGWTRLIEWAEGKGYKVGLHNGKIYKSGPSIELQFEATKLLIEYGFGKPMQPSEVNVDVPEFSELSPRAIEQILEVIKTPVIGDAAPGI